MPVSVRPVATTEMTSTPADHEVTPLAARDPRVPVATARRHEDRAQKVATTATPAHLEVTDQRDPARAAQARRVLRAATTVIVTREHPGPARTTRTVADHVPIAATTATAVTDARVSRHAAPDPTRVTVRATRVPVVPQMGDRRVRAS